MIDAKDRLRRPAYTGDERCWRCTATNAVLLALGVGILALGGRRGIAAAVALVGAAAIWLRGYLVPYTPRFAPRLVGALPTRVFGSDDAIGRNEGSLSDADPGAGDDAESDGPTGESVVTALLEANVVVPDGETFVLEDAFRTEWRREMDRLRDRDLEGLAAEANSLTDSSIDAGVGRDWRGRVSTVRLEGETGPAVSLDEGVAIAELAAASALQSRIDDEALRRAAGTPLRSLLERCPRCDGDLTVTRATCCGEVTRPGSAPPEKLICPDCDVRLFTHD